MAKAHIRQSGPSVEELNDNDAKMKMIYNMYRRSSGSRYLMAPPSCVRSLPLWRELSHINHEE
jgi:hypothetical protein